MFDIVVNGVALVRCDTIAQQVAVIGQCKDNELEYEAATSLITWKAEFDAEEWLSIEF